MRKTGRLPTDVSYHIAGEVARVTFQGPKGIQLLSSATRQQLSEVLSLLEQQPALRVVVFEGTGRTFVAGADVQEFLGLNRERARHLAREGQVLISRIAALPCLTIAALNGACVGGGLELALACDFRLAKENCVLGFPEVGLGLLPCWGGTTRASQLLPTAVVSRLILTGELMSANWAFQQGIIHEAAEENQWEELVESWLARLLDQGPLAQRLVKRLLRKNAMTPSQLALGLADEVNAFEQCVLAGQVEQGVTAYLQKRSANWGNHETSASS